MCCPVVPFVEISTFAPFNSKFDKYRNGEETLSASEQRGLVLFNGKAECVACHVSEGKKALSQFILLLNYDCKADKKMSTTTLTLSFIKNTFTIISLK